MHPVFLSTTLLGHSQVFSGRRIALGQWLGVGWGVAVWIAPGHPPWDPVTDPLSILPTISHLPMQHLRLPMKHLRLPMKHLRLPMKHPSWRRMRMTRTCPPVGTWHTTVASLTTTHYYLMESFRHSGRGQCESS